MLPPNTFGTNGMWLRGIPWAVYTPRPSGSGTSAALTYGTGNVVRLPIIINWSDLDTAIETILGVNQFNTTTGNLDRTLPVRHPDTVRYSWLYAMAIQSIQELQFDGKTTLSNTAYANYKFAIITILFAQPRWIMLSDAYLDSNYGPWTAFGGRQEWRRFVTYEGEPVPEVISRKGGQFKYVDGPYGPGGTNAVFPLSKNVPINSREIKLTWRRVPLNGLRSAGGVGLETNQNAAMLSVNSNDNDPSFFPPLRAGQWLMEGWKAVEMESPVDPVAFGANLILTPGLLVDVQISFRYKQPPTTPGYSTAFGHLLFPSPGGDLNWYYAQSNDGTNSPILPSTDFRKIFQLNL